MMWQDIIDDAKEDSRQNGMTDTDWCRKTVSQ